MSFDITSMPNKFHMLEVVTKNPLLHKVHSLEGRKSVFDKYKLKGHLERHEAHLTETTTDASGIAIWYKLHITSLNQS